MKRQFSRISGWIARLIARNGTPANTESSHGSARQPARRFAGPVVVELANEKSGVPDMVFSFVNEGGEALNKLDADGWADVLIPFGSATHHIPDPAGSGRRVRVEQVFANADAEAVAAEFRKGIKSRTLGLPWFIGHPDHPDFQDRDKDIRAYARIKDVFANSDGLVIRARFNDAGRAIIEGEQFSGYSPRFRVRQSSDGTYRPFKLLSVGFTNEPAMSGIDPILANEDLPGNPGNPNPNQTNQPSMNKIKELLISLGMLKPGAPDDETTIHSGVQALANEKRTAEERATKAEADLANEKTAREKAEADLANEKTGREKAETDLANERKDRVTPIVDAAIKAGKVAKDKRDETIADLANSDDLPKAVTDLANSAGFKVESLFGDAIGGKPDIGDGDQSGDVMELANELSAKYEGEGMAPTKAWNRGYQEATKRLAKSGD